MPFNMTVEDPRCRIVGWGKADQHGSLGGIRGSSLLNRIVVVPGPVVTTSRLGGFT